MKDILQSMKPEIENAIANDFGFVDFGARYKEAQEHAAEIQKAKIELQRINTEISEKTRASRALDNGLNELRSMVRRLATY